MRETVVNIENEKDIEETPTKGNERKESIASLTRETIRLLGNDLVKLTEDV